MKKCEIKTTQVRVNIRFERKRLLEKVANGDPRASHALVQRYGNRVWSITSRLLNNEGEALLATRRIFASLRRYAQYYQSDRVSEALFVTIVARRFCLQQKKRLKAQSIVSCQVQQQKAKNDEADAVTKDVDRSVGSMKKVIPFPNKWKREFSRESAAVLQAMKHVAERDQLLMKQHMVDGFSIHELADQHDLAVMVVQSRIKNGLSVIMRHLSTYSKENVVWH